MRFDRVEEVAILSAVNLPRAVVAELRRRYSEPHRHYHDWTHALSVLAWCNHACEAVAFDTEDIEREGHWLGADLRNAALFHDAVYVVGASDNEEKSAKLAFDLGASSGRVYELILATARHGKLEAGDVLEPVALFLDCDLASFGEPRWEVALWNDDRVVAELLQRYTAEQVGEGRAKFLEGLLAKRSIFLSPYFRALLEDQARHNIEKLLKRRPIPEHGSLG